MRWKQQGSPPSSHPPALFKNGGKSQTSIKKYCKIKWTLPAAEASRRAAVRLWQSAGSLRRRQPCSSAADRGAHGAPQPGSSLPSLAKLSGTNGQEDIGCKGRGGSSPSLDPDIFGGFLLTQLQTLVKGTSCRCSGGRKRLCLGERGSRSFFRLLQATLDASPHLRMRAVLPIGGIAPDLDVAVSVKTRVVRE